MEQEIKQILAKLDDHSTIHSVRPVSGGQINQAFKVETDRDCYFIKTNDQAAANFFSFEKIGLERIASTKTIAVPEVYYCQETTRNESAFLVLEWIEETNNTSAYPRLGEQLASLHQHTHVHYGLDVDGFLGTLAQPNNRTDSWVDYYKNYRLQTQLKYGIDQGIIQGNRRKKLEKLMNKLSNYIPDEPEASLLHGDLWSGNFLIGSNGQPYLVDPAILVGDRAFELAYTELFGGFPADFYHAYNEVWPLDKEYTDVKPIYQLFYLLVHLNIFGEHYGCSVDEILNKYT